MGKILYFLVHCAMSTRHDPNPTPNITSGLFFGQCHFVGGREDTAGFPEAPSRWCSPGNGKPSIGLNRVWRSI